MMLKSEGKLGIFINYIKFSPTLKTKFLLTNQQHSGYFGIYIITYTQSLISTYENPD